MMRTRSFSLLLAGAIGLAALSLAGCQGSSDPEIPKAATESMDKLGAGARASGGDWDKLTADQQKEFLARNGGNEANARAMLKQMAGAMNQRGPKGPGGRPATP